MSALTPCVFRLPVRDPHQMRQILQAVEGLTLPAPGALITQAALAECCRLQEADLLELLNGMESEGWLLPREGQQWELPLAGARAVEETLPRNEQLRARTIRAQVLAALCGSETAERDPPVHYRVACAAVDAHGGELRAAIRWLVAEGHLHWYHVGGYVSATPAGKEALRRMARAAPEGATQQS